MSSPGRPGRSPAEPRAAAVEGAEHDVELLPRDTPPRVARVLSMFLIAVFLGLLAFAAFVPLPESVRCRFVLAPEGGSAPVTSPEPGVVLGVLVQLGEEVAAGQPLLSIVPYVEPGASPPELRARQERLSAELASAESLDAQLALQHASRMEQLASDLASARAAAEVASSRVATMTRLTEQLERAAAEGAVSQQELLDRREAQQEAELDLATATRSATAAQRAMAAARSARHVEMSEREVVRRRIEGELAEAQASLLEISGLGSESEEADTIVVRAPHDGIVLALGAERAGIVVERGQPLVTVARSGARLRAEISVPERGAARVSKGQVVRLLFDAYPYTRHGVLTGLVTWVSPAAQGGNLAAFASLADASIMVDEKRRPLLPGMSGEARIDVGSRTLLEYVFEPLQQMREALRSTD